MRVSSDQENLNSFFFENSVSIPVERAIDLDLVIKLSSLHKTLHKFT